MFYGLQELCINFFPLLQPREDNSSEVLLALIPLCVTDASICWWISFLEQTKIDWFETWKMTTNSLFLCVCVSTHTQSLSLSLSLCDFVTKTLYYLIRFKNILFGQWTLKINLMMAIEPCLSDDNWTNI